MPPQVGCGRHLHTQGRPWGSWGPNKGAKNRVLYHLGLFPRLFGGISAMVGPWAGCKGPLVPPSRVKEAYVCMGVVLGHMGASYAAQKAGFWAIWAYFRAFLAACRAGRVLRWGVRGPCAPSYDGVGRLQARARPWGDRGPPVVLQPRPNQIPHLQPAARGRVR